MMSTNEKEIDRLTRELLEGTAERPSASLNDRIMGLIFQERRKRSVAYVRRGLTPLGVFGLFLAYALVCGGILWLMGNTAGSVARVTGAMRAYFPLLVAAASAIACFFLFTQVDNWLRWAEKKKKGE